MASRCRLGVRAVPIKFSDTSEDRMTLGFATSRYRPLKKGYNFRNLSRCGERGAGWTCSQKEPDEL